MPLPLAAIAGGGALLSGVGSMMGQNSQNSANQAAANMLGSAWQPISTQTGAASASFDPETGFSTGLTGDVAEWQKQLFSQAMGGGTGQGADLFSQGQGMFANAMNAPQVDVAGMAGEQNALLQQLAQPGQDRAAGGLMAQLMASGKLGSSGGAGMFGELKQAQDMADLARSSQAIQGAQGAASLQNQINQGMFGNAMNVMGMGNQMTQQDFMNQLASGGAATDLFNLENQAGMMATNLGGQQFNAALAQAPLISGQGSNPFAAMIGGAGSGMLDRGLDSLF